MHRHGSLCMSGLSASLSCSAKARSLYKFGVQVLPETAVFIASKLEVPACGHKPGAIKPPFPSPEDMALAQAAHCKMLIARPVLKPRIAKLAPDQASGSRPSKTLGGHAGKTKAPILGSASHLQTCRMPSSLASICKGKMPMVVHHGSRAASPSQHPAKRLRIRDPQSLRIRAVLQAHADALKNEEMVVPTGPNYIPNSAQGAAVHRSMGPLLDRLPFDTLSAIMSLLAHEDIASLGLTCQGLRQWGCMA